MSEREQTHTPEQIEDFVGLARRAVEAALAFAQLGYPAVEAIGRLLGSETRRAYDRGRRRGHQEAIAEARRVIIHYGARERYQREGAEGVLAALVKGAQC